MFRRIRGERGSVQDQGRKRGRRLMLGAFCVGLVALLGAVQPGAGMSPAAIDSVHWNLESRLDALDGGELTSVVIQLEAPATDELVASLEGEVGPLRILRRFSV